MARIGVIVREGLLFGALGGIFVLIVRLVSVQATSSVSTTTFSDFVTSALTLLIIGGAGRKVAAITKSTTAGFQMGALAGGTSEIFRTVVAGIILSYLPAGEVAVAHMSAADKAIADDPTKLILNLAFYLALAILFGAIIGWMGAWSLLRFRPPREPRG